MTDMPQMVAIYNGMGGGAAAAIAAVEFARGEMHGTVVTLLATLGALIGSPCPSRVRWWPGPSFRGS
jgi:NAD(P) transhydrogenase subunit beta